MSEYRPKSFIYSKNVTKNIEDVTKKELFSVPIDRTNPIVDLRAMQPSTLFWQFSQM